MNTNDNDTVQFFLDYADKVAKFDKGKANEFIELANKLAKQDKALAKIEKHNKKAKKISDIIFHDEKIDYYIESCNTNNNFNIIEKLLDRIKDYKEIIKQLEGHLETSERYIKTLENRLNIKNVWKIY